MQAPRIPNWLFAAGFTLAGIGAIATLAAVVWGIVWIVRHVRFA